MYTNTLSVSSPSLPVAPLTGEVAAHAAESTAHSRLEFVQASAGASQLK